jgi:hypothetical protein
MFQRHDNINGRDIRVGVAIAEVHVDVETLTPQPADLPERCGLSEKFVVKGMFGKERGKIARDIIVTVFISGAFV